MTGCIHVHLLYISMHIYIYISIQIQWIKYIRFPQTWTLQQQNRQPPCCPACIAHSQLNCYCSVGSFNRLQTGLNTGNVSWIYWEYYVDLLAPWLLFTFQAIIPNGPCDGLPLYWWWSWIENSRMMVLACFSQKGPHFSTVPWATELEYRFHSPVTSASFSPLVPLF